MPRQLGSGFSFSMFSDNAFECMTALIYFKDAEFAQISIDNGIDKPEIDFLLNTSEPNFIPLASLNEAIAEAIKELSFYV